MLRVVLTVGSVLILGVLVMHHAVTLPRGTTLTLPAHVDQGIPLATIDLLTAGEALTPDEIAQGTLWWQHQRQVLLDQLTDLLRKESRADGWTNLYASATTDGGHVVVVVGNQGRLGTVRFAGDGTLLACDATPDHVLPIILPSVDGGFRRPTAAAMHGIEARLRYLREGSPVAWHTPVIPEAIPIIEVPVEDEDSTTMLVFSCAAMQPEAFGVAPVRNPAIHLEIPVESEPAPSVPRANN